MISEIDISKKVYSESIIRRYREHGDSVLFCTMPYNRKPFIIDILHKFEFRKVIPYFKSISYHWINRSGRLFDTMRSQRIILQEDFTIPGKFVRFPERRPAGIVKSFFYVLVCSSLGGIIV